MKFIINFFNLSNFIIYFMSFFGYFWLFFFGNFCNHHFKCLPYKLCSINENLSTMLTVFGNGSFIDKFFNLFLSFLMNVDSSISIMLFTELYAECVVNPIF
eukprot:305985_1